MPVVGERRAVVDVGSNSVLFIVAEWTGADWTPIVETSEVTGLGTGTSQTGLLAQSSMAGTLRAILRAFHAASAKGATCRAFGTMALRIAANSDEFVRRAAEQGTPVEVLSAEDEAQLGLECVLRDPLFSPHGLLTVVDVGGHSTEVSTAEPQAGKDLCRVLTATSLPLGTLGLRSGPLRRETPTTEDLAQAVAQIDRLLAEADLVQGAAVVALGASATNLVAIRDRILPWSPERVHGAFLATSEVADAALRLSRLGEAERAALPGIERGRESTIHAGAFILCRLLHRLGAEGCYVSVRGWRHAMLDRFA